MVTRKEVTNMSNRPTCRQPRMKNYTSRLLIGHYVLASVECGYRSLTARSAYWVGEAGEQNGQSLLLPFCQPPRVDVLVSFALASERVETLISLPNSKS